MERSVSFTNNKTKLQTSQSSRDGLRPYESLNQFQFCPSYQVGREYFPPKHLQLPEWFNLREAIPLYDDHDDEGKSYAYLPGIQPEAVIECDLLTRLPVTESHSEFEFSRRGITRGMKISRN